MIRRATSIPLNSQGQAIIEVKTGNGQYTTGQAEVYPAAVAGNATAVGGNAVKIDVQGQIAPTPVIVLRKN